MFKICSWWPIIGECLGIESGELDCLHCYKRDIDKLSEVLQLWMKRTTKPVTWNTILEVIGSPPIQNKSVVMEIEKFLECEYLYNIWLYLKCVGILHRKTQGLWWLIR